MNDSEKDLLKALRDGFKGEDLLKTLKGGRIVEVVNRWTHLIRYGIVVGDVVSYIDGGCDNINYLVKTNEENYYINRVLELKPGATMYISMGNNFRLHEEDYIVVYNREKRLTLKDIDYDIEYFMICKGRTGCIVKCDFSGVDYIITRADKQSEYISIEPLETVEKIISSYTIYEIEEEYNNNLVDEDDNFEEYPY